VRETARALEQANRAVLAQARTALATDASETLRLLTTLSPAASGWDVARVIAADALSRPRVVATVSVDALSRADSYAVDTAHGRAFAWGAGEDAKQGAKPLWTIDLATGAVTAASTGNGSSQLPDRMYACEDGKRLIGARHLPFYSNIDLTASGELHRLGDGGFYMVVVDLATGAREAMLLDATAAWRFAAPCRADFRLDVDHGHLVWWDDRAAAPRILADGIAAAMLSSDHRHAVSVDDRGVTQWWDLAANTSKALGTFRNARLLAMSSDGRVVVIHDVRNDRAVALRVGRPPIELRLRDATWVVAPDGGWLAAGTRERVVWLRGDRFERAEDLLVDRVQELTLSDDGHYLIARAAHAYVWDMAAGAYRQTLGDRGTVAARVVGAARMLTRDEAGTLQIWQLAVPRLVLADPHAVSLSPDGRWIVDETADGLRRIDTSGASPAEFTRWPAPPPASMTLRLQDGAIARNGDVIVTLERDVWVWPRGGAWNRLGPAPETGRAQVSWTRAGAAMAMTDSEIVVWERGAVRNIAPFPTLQARRLVAVRDDLALAAAATVDGTVSLVDLSRKTEIALPGSRDWGQFSGDGHALVTGTADPAIDSYVWDVASARGHPIEGRDELWFRAIARDGRRVAVQRRDAIVVVDVADGTQWILPRSKGSLQVVFDDAGRRLIIGSNDNVTLWDIAAREGRVLLDDAASAVAEGRGLIVVPHRGVVQLTAIAAGQHAITVATRHGVFQFTDDLPFAPRELRATIAAKAPSAPLN
jgi:hypothetical protein